ncbi:MAG TPA: ornithine cyclodeaminase family protein [Paraburkholderia sp.]|nr:ornithine cyclodeaminase family protein [Paraburkholderia sp.]
MKVWTKDEIVARFDAARAVSMIEDGLIASSRGQVQLPPVQNFQFTDADGDCCVKSAYVAGAETFVVKVSTGFYRNPSRGLPSNNGLMLAFSAHTGEPVALLQDEGWLTCVRTALAGQIVARLLAPSAVEAIGVIGTGEQARLQLEHLMPVTACRTVYVWGRGEAQLQAFAHYAETLGFRVHTTQDAQTVAQHARLIVTTTPSRGPLLLREWIHPGTHITAVGADGPGKQELDPTIIGAANLVVADSIAQCVAYGEISHAVSAGLVAKDTLIELGAALAAGRRLREHDDQITVADLTGVAVQDSAIAGSVLV